MPEESKLLKTKILRFAQNDKHKRILMGAHCALSKYKGDGQGMKKLHLHQLKAEKPQFEQIIAHYITDESVKEPLSHFAQWLKANDITAEWHDIGEQPALAWIIKSRGKKHFLTWGGGDSFSIMLRGLLSDDYQAFICENDLQDFILENVQRCARADGGHCSNCDLPPDVPGVEKVLFGKEVTGLCCGKFVTFDNPSGEVIEQIKKLL